MFGLRRVSPIKPGLILCAFTFHKIEPSLFGPTCVWCSSTIMRRSTCEAIDRAKARAKAEAKALS